MEAIKVYTGKSVPMMQDNIDTNQIMPNQFLKRIEKTGFGEFVFYDWRYLRFEKPNPDFVLNKEERQGASILITGENFGYGSSREHAVWGLTDYGFRIVIAGSFSDIFYMNCTKNGLLPIRIPDRDIRVQLAKLPANNQITIDLPEQKIIVPFGEITFEIDKNWKRKFILGIDDIDETLMYEDAIIAYEMANDSKYS